MWVATLFAPPLSLSLTHSLCRRACMATVASVPPHAMHPSMHVDHVPFAHVSRCGLAGAHARSGQSLSTFQGGRRRSTPSPTRFRSRQRRSQSKGSSTWPWGRQPASVSCSPNPSACQQLVHAQLGSLNLCACQQLLLLACFDASCGMRIDARCEGGAPRGGYERTWPMDLSRPALTRPHRTS
jgi:hypothetical protein